MTGMIGRAVLVALSLGWFLPAQAAWIEVNTATAHQTKTLETTYDAYGNATRVLITQQARRADGVVESMTTLNQNTYYAPDLVRWRTNQLDTATITHTQGSSTLTKVSKTVYDSNTGAVAQEISEPNKPDFKVVTRYVRDAWGNVTLTGVRADYSTTPAKRVAEVISTTTYDSTLRLFPVTQTNALGHTLTRNYDLNTGNLLSETGPNGLTSYNQYDIFGRVVASMTADGTKTLTTYAHCAGDSNCPTHARFSVKTQVVKDPNTALPPGGAPDLAGTPITPESYTYFDSLRRELYSRTQSLDGRWVISGRKEFNSQGEVTRSAEPYFQGATDIKWTTYTYDLLGRTTQIRTPNNKVSSIAYGGLRTTYTNELNQKRTEDVGLQGQPVQVVDAVGTAEAATNLYEYDALGRLLKVTDANGKLRQYTYDLAGNKLTDQDPNQGTWSYQYNSIGQLISQTDAKGQTTQISYDVLGRMVQRQAPDFNSQWVYDTATKGIGKLAQVTASNGYTRSHAYDTLGRPIQTTTRVDSQDYTLSTSYDSLGRVQSLTYPTGISYHNVYSSRGFLTKVQNADGQRVYWQISDTATTTADAHGRLLRTTLGNGVQTLRSYDPLTGQLTSLAAGTNSARNNVQNDSYLHDALGNLLSRSEHRSNLTETFQYDAHNRLTSATVVGQTARTVQYDKVGNITYKSDIGYYRYHSNRPQAVAEVCRNSSMATGSCTQSYATYAYDANGNVSTGGGRTFTWTAFNKPLSTSRSSTGKTESFAYDADYQRIKHVHTDGATTLYINPRLDSGAHFEIKRNGAVTEYTHHVYANGEAVAALVTLNTGAAVNKLNQSFAANTTGLVLPTASADPAGAVKYDAAGQRLTLHTLQTAEGTTAKSPLVRSSTYYAASEGVKLSVDVSLASSSGTGRVISLGLNNAGSTAAAQTGARDLRAYISGNKLYARVTSKNPNGGTASTLNHLLGEVTNTHYTLEIEAHESGSSLYFYPKGGQRNAGYQYSTHLPQLGQLRFVAYGRSGPANSDSLTYLDNLRIDEGGVSISAAHPQERYLHTDHLGSIVAVTDNQGRILERSSYDAWGKRRNLDGSDDQAFDTQGLGILPSLSTHHGFTGHEMLDDMTLVHMNGRLYDPIIARFISADPHIDGLYSTQGLNSYSYVHNNPLSATDPSGYFLKKIFKGIKKALSGLNSIRKSVQNALNRPFYKVIRALGPVAQPLVAVGSIIACQGMAPQCYAAVMGAGSFAVAHANGASTSQALRIGAISGATAYAGAHVADWIGSYTADLQFAPKLTNVSLHGLRGGVTSVVSGGDFRSGFLAGSFGAFGDVNGLTRSQYGAAIVGGIGAKLGGGSFAEGAIIAIIGRRFNHESHEERLERIRKFREETRGSLNPFKIIRDEVPKWWRSDETSDLRYGIRLTIDAAAIPAKPFRIASDSLSFIDVGNNLLSGNYSGAAIGVTSIFAGNGASHFMKNFYTNDAALRATSTGIQYSTSTSLSKDCYTCK
ncbi:RHS repeat-associated core domain-containing protein [Halopseudomonas litoralis]|uniref:RHS repeat-associated core domain-containing protein n=1 Tax=Halopseudomonas litoralis TaxID=797277 RepID=A0A1H1QBM8_9GAMM|nr:RHS repeat-associated core domain-containing protein [Halopseudomonas litoralis]SDS20928.1 RHS repeat-associated core domain-containing protein [Halopseudomonas litoralis]